MPKKPKSWAQKMEAKPPHTVRLSEPFAGVPAGAQLLISSPQEIARFLSERTSAGQTLSIQQLRRELAAAHRADATCPVSTSIFLRTVSAFSWEQVEAGRPVAEVAPFWRVVEPESPLARRLPCGPDWIRQQRAAEQAGPEA